jgi:hypothetical protein
MIHLHHVLVALKWLPGLPRGPQASAWPDVAAAECRWENVQRIDVLWSSEEVQEAVNTVKAQFHSPLLCQQMLQGVSSPHPAVLDVTARQNLVKCIVAVLFVLDLFLWRCCISVMILRSISSANP